MSYFAAAAGPADRGPAPRRGSSALARHRDVIDGPRHPQQRGRVMTETERRSREAVQAAMDRRDNGGETGH